MKITVLLNNGFDSLYKYENVQKYEIDTKTGFLKINDEEGNVVFFKLREVLYFRVFK